jgi:hypothetical protein
MTEVSVVPDECALCGSLSTSRDSPISLFCKNCRSVTAISSPSSEGGFQGSAIRAGGSAWWTDDEGSLGMLGTESPAAKITPVRHSKTTRRPDTSRRAVPPHARSRRGPTLHRTHPVLSQRGDSVERSLTLGIARQEAARFSTSTPLRSTVVARPSPVGMPRAKRTPDRSMREVGHGTVRPAVLAAGAAAELVSPRRNLREKVQILGWTTVF